MPLVIGVAAEAVSGERRLPVVPEVVKKYAGLGARVLVQRGAGAQAHFPDEVLGDVDFADSAEDIYAQSDVVLCVQAPAAKLVGKMKPGAVLLGMLQPWADAKRVQAYAKQGITGFALELLPRISRAQSMDILSSQASVAGYEAALIAANHCPKFFPMLTYAAGSVRPARVLVIGAGVAGLQAIATARRLGAMVEGYDVRPETREQVESLGAKFVDTGVNAVGEGGYARELTDEEKALQAERLGKAIAQCDALITTASVPGRQAPKIVTKEMVARMKAGAVIVDLAAEGGGNVEGTVAGKETMLGNVLVVGPVNIASRMPVHASEMFAKNLFNFISPFIQDGALSLDWEDEVMSGSALVHEGAVCHAGVRQALGLQDNE